MSNIVIYHNNLCPDVWDENYNLNSGIRLNLLKTAKDFYEKTKFEAPILDIYFMGSMASFNWNVESDIDVHVVIDLKSLKMPEETSEKMAKLVGSQWNSEHEILIKGHKVEMNIQSLTAEKPYVNGIYSLVKNVWVKIPSKQNPDSINTPAIQLKYGGVKKYILDTIATGDREKLKEVKDYIDAFRQYGLDNGGELSIENITYKLLRTKGIIQQLKDAISNIYDKQLSINEHLESVDINANTKNFNIRFGDDGLNKKTAKILLNEKWFANSYKLLEGFGHGNMKDGEWVINAHEEAFRLNFKSPPISFPTLQDLLNYLEKWYESIELKEVKQSDLKQRHPVWAGNNISQLTLDNLNALKNKSVRFYNAGKKSENQEMCNQAVKDYIVYRNEIKRRLEIINRPINEVGYNDTMTDDEKYDLANTYFDIGHDEDTGDDEGEPPATSYCWIWDGSKIIAKKDTTHGMAFSHDVANMNFKGRYDTGKDKISIVFPDHELRKLGNKRPTVDDIPTNVYNKLISKFGKNNQFVVFENKLNESVDVDYNSQVDFLERRDTQLLEISHFLKSNKSGNIPWKTISATLLKKTWLLFGKYNKVNDNAIDKIADQLLTNIVRLTLANEFTGHSENYHLREEIDEMCDIQFTDEEWEAVCWRFEDKNGKDYISDYGIRPLQNIYTLIFNAETPEAKLYACDKALNVVHQRNDLAAMFVEGGQSTLTQIANQGGYNAGYEYGQMNREFREEKIDNKHSRIVKENETHILPLSAFTGGYCAEFALALHEKTNYPIVSFDELIDYGDGDIEHQSIHYTCKHNNLYYDAKGKRTEEDIRKNLLGSDMKPTTKVEIRELTSEYLVNETGIEPEALEQARKIVSRMKNIKEGFGGNPETDKAYVKGDRWRVKWDNAEKTPLMREGKLGMFPYKFWLDNTGHIHQTDDHDTYVLNYFKMESGNEAYDKALTNKWYRGQTTGDTVFLVGLHPDFNKSQRTAIEDLFMTDLEIKYVVFVNDVSSGHGRTKIILSRTETLNENMFPKEYGQMNREFREGINTKLPWNIDYTKLPVETFASNPYWISPNNKVYDAGESHAWFAKEYLYPDLDYVPARQEALKNGWIRIRTHPTEGILEVEGNKLNSEQKKIIKELSKLQNLKPIAASKLQEIELEEGFGGNPDTDKAYVKGDRWRVKWDNAKKTPLMKESISQGLFKWFKQQLPTWPDYVINDIFVVKLKSRKEVEEKREHMNFIKKKYPNMKWELKVLEVTFDIFDRDTQDALKKRDGGKCNPNQVPNDVARHAVQSNLLKSRGVSKEPLIMIKNGNSYSLWEGWHRTIQNLNQFPNGYKCNAWIGIP
jgi:hypothetical protein